MYAPTIDRQYVRETERTVPMGGWDKSFLHTLQRFRHLHTRDDEDVKRVKSSAALKACKYLKSSLAKLRVLSVSMVP